MRANTWPPHLTANFKALNTSTKFQPLTFKNIFLYKARLFALYIVYISFLSTVPWILKFINISTIQVIPKRCLITLTPTPAPENPRSDCCPSGSAFSRMSYKRNHTVCSLLSLGAFHLRFFVRERERETERETENLSIE